jgi:transmembrane sensor
VELNSGSTLRYARRFDRDTRRVTLEGEAFFDVAKAGTPFVIETFNARVTVLGTSFNVRAWPDDPTAETVVSVVEGLVEVTAKASPDETTRLEAGEAAHVAAVNPAPPQPEMARLDEATAWRDGRFVFINQPLGVMFDEIERRFDIDITASEQIRAHAHNIGTTARSAEQLIGEICQSSSTLKLRYRATANGFEVFGTS